ncbi:MAG: sigma-70 family RNA polymerase sigma factor [Pyrinomonadaceae bacterium]
MISKKHGQVSELLAKWNGGEPSAWDELVPVIYGELRDHAHRLLRHERSDHTFQTTDLVHEAYIKLAGQRIIDWESRAHFFWLASEIMRRILVDYARRRNRNKRGGDKEVFRLNSAFQIAIDSSGVDVVGLDEALTRLASFDPQQAKIVELRFFGGRSIQETAETLGISTATVKRDWAVAKAWLHHELSSNP